jgi:hypothetical protein
LSREQFRQRLGGVVLKSCIRMMPLPCFSSWLTAEIKKSLNPTPHGGEVVRLSST